MGGKPEKIFLQRWNIVSQQTPEKMLKISHNQRNANQNYNEVSLHTGQNGHHQKNLQTINAKEDVGKETILHCWEM